MYQSDRIEDMRDDAEVNLKTAIYLCATRKKRLVGVSCTFRDQDYQTALNKQGKAPAKVSFHGKDPKGSLAVDIFQNIQGHLYDEDFFNDVAPIFKEVGFSWMFDIAEYDKCHFQWDNHRKVTGQQLINGTVVPQMPKFTIKEAVVLDNTPDNYQEAKDAVNFALESKILKGDKNGNLKLHSTVNRQELAIFMKRLYDKLKK